MEWDVVDNNKLSGSSVIAEVDEEDFTSPSGPTLLAKRLRRLKSAAWTVTESRERVPQPFFWSLFHSEVDTLRKRRAEQREARRKALYGAILDDPSSDNS